MYTCNKCGKEIKTVSALSVHNKYCKGNKSTLTQLERNNGEYICPYCNKSFNKYGIVPHINGKHKNRNNLESYNKSGKGAWNKGLSKGNNNSVLKASNTLKESIKKGKFIPSGCINWTSEELRKMCLEKKCGGVRPGAGRGISGRYKGIWCDSTWELAFVIYNIDKGIIIKRVKEGRKYEYKGKYYLYYPDFIVEDKIYEIKGYMTEKDYSKREQNPDVIFLFESDLFPILNYVINKYGKDFYKLYDK